MDTYQYTKIPVQFFTDEIHQEYNVSTLQHNGFIHVEINNGMYGLKEAGITAFKRLIKNIVPHDYHPVKHTPGLLRQTG